VDDLVNKPSAGCVLGLASLAAVRCSWPARWWQWPLSNRSAPVSEKIVADAACAQNLFCPGLCLDVDENWNYLQILLCGGRDKEPSTATQRRVTCYRLAASTVFPSAASRTQHGPESGDPGVPRLKQRVDQGLRFRDGGRKWTE
jgi:hypothetical protein